MTALMSIGEFALTSGLSVKALRFYDDRGLLAPADVDPHSGYRRYAYTQVRTAARIRVLRAAGLSVEDVRSALESPDRLREVLAAHAEELHRARDLEDRALAIARTELSAGTDAGPDVFEREVPATPWAGVVMPIRLADMGATDTVDAANEQAGEHFNALAAALMEAGLGIAGAPWTGVRPAGRGGDVVDMVLAVPVTGAAPASFAVTGLATVTGVLPHRVERYVVVQAGDDVDLLDDAPGGPLPDPAMLVLVDALAEAGVDLDPGEDATVRQILVDPEAGVVELAATLRTLVD